MFEGRCGKGSAAPSNVRFVTSVTHTHPGHSVQHAFIKDNIQGDLTETQEPSLWYLVSSKVTYSYVDHELFSVIMLIQSHAFYMPKCVNILFFILCLCVSILDILFKLRITLILTRRCW